MKSVTLKVGGSHKVVFERFSLFHGARNMCIYCVPNPSGQVVHNHHLVLRGGKIPIQSGHHMWKILAPTYRQLMGPRRKTSKCQPNKNIVHAQSMRFLYVYLAHMVVGTTLHQEIPTIHVDFYLAGRKRIKILGGNTFQVTHALMGSSCFTKF